MAMTKINKAKARKLYNEGATIYLAPCKANGYTLWFGGPTGVTKAECGDFDKLINSFEYYNCQHNELGKYAAYYIK